MSAAVSDVVSDAGPVLDRSVDGALAVLERRLLADRAPGAAWAGELSSSALATALAIAALHSVDRDRHRAAIARGADWLCRHANDDGGWGDSPTSPSHLSTTTLAWAALHLVRGPAARDLDSGEEWIRARIGGLEPARLAAALLSAYGRDRTFSAPILTVTALAGVLGARDAWRLVPQLPFELGVLPHRLLSWLRLPVVSYALPALIAIGLVRHEHRKSRWPWIRALRACVRSRVLGRLGRIQPSSGGFLEATPLTAFVALSLAGCGLRQSLVTQRCIAFLRAGQRADGSWPIDSNLATWVTTLSVKALGAKQAATRLCGEAAGWGAGALRETRDELREWLLGQQHRRHHSFTQAAPGGFGWTDLPGGVPDADDTAGALVALHALDPTGEATRDAARLAGAWLVDLQNADGGVPTFCRGWGRLAFDRSSPDVTAHAIRALSLWMPQLDRPAARRVRRFVRRALDYLARSQQPDGSWLPLWFGNPWQPGGVNAAYGTAQVLEALAGGGWDGETAARLERAASWLVRARNADGGWGRGARGGSTIEETGVALAALAGRTGSRTLDSAAAWLVARCEAGELEPAPIGLYFSSLRYSERLYPIVFALTGLARYARARRGRDAQPTAEGRAA